MELTKKGVAMAAGGAAITVIASAVVTWTIATSSAGVDAAERARVENIIEEYLELDDGRTYGQAITAMDKNIGNLQGDVRVITGEVENIDENVDLIRQAMQAIAEDMP